MQKHCGLSDHMLKESCKEKAQSDEEKTRTWGKPEVTDSLIGLFCELNA